MQESEFKPFGEAYKVPQIPSALVPAQQPPRRRLPLFSSLSFSLLLSGLIWSHTAAQTELERAVEASEGNMSSLIDEIGELNEVNTLLAERLNTQDAVLKSMSDGFRDLQTELGGAEGGDYAFLEDMLSEVSAELEKVPTNSNVQLAEVEEDETLDILILGTHGAHTDTIIVASVNEAKKKISLISIPRDLYINGRRINGYYTYYGVDHMMRMVETVTGLKLDQFVQVDMEGFEKIVDLVGGLDIYVDKAIHDGTYPGPNGTYEPYSIEVGSYHMSGSEALKYARSRHSESDFGRAARQQKVIDALKTKLTQLDVVMNMKQLTQLFQTGLSSSTTDIKLLDLVSYYYDFKDYELSTGFVLNSSNYLFSLINESGAYTLLPKGGNFDEIHQVISDLVN